MTERERRPPLMGPAAAIARSSGSPRVPDYQILNQTGSRRKRVKGNLTLAEPLARRCVITLQRRDAWTKLDSGEAQGRK